MRTHTTTVTFDSALGATSARINVPFSAVNCTVLAACHSVIANNNVSLLVKWDQTDDVLAILDPNSRLPIAASVRVTHEFPSSFAPVFRLVEAESGLITATDYGAVTLLITFAI